MSRSKTETRSVRRTWLSQDDFEVCTRDRGIDNRARGVRLARTVMLQDERGMTHRENRQTLSDEVQALKEFVLGPADMVDGRLYVFGDPARLEVNGQRVKPIRRLPSTGWSVARVPAEVLRAGVNRFVFSGGGEMLVEESMCPDRSALSTDGGATWDYDSMGPQGMNDGEFLVRLRLERYPVEATITSQPIDLAALAAEDGICPRFESAKVDLTCEADAPTGTRVRLEARCSGDGQRWSAWSDAAKIGRRRRLPRFLQWRAVLGSDSGRTTPVLPEVSLEAEVRSTAGKPTVRVVEADGPAEVLGSYRFAYQGPTDRLTRLREQYGLDEVVAGCDTEMERFVALRDWCRHTAPKGWDSGRTDWCPPFDALVILETNQDPRALCMCTHYTTLMVETAAALGYVGRHVILDHHCVAELWCNDLRKWVLMDTGNSEDPERNCHFEHEGVPLNALEIRRLWQQGRTREIQVVYPRRKPVTGDTLKPQEQCSFEGYRRFGAALRNNFLDTPFPGELTHGWGSYFCDVYLWWEDEAVPRESPEYGLTSNRPGDYYRPVNETRITLLATERPGVVAVELRTDTPNFEAFEVRTRDGDWRDADACFEWTVPDDGAAIEARSRNRFGIRGPVRRMVVGRTG